MKKKILAVLLVLCAVVLFALTASAATDTSVGYTVNVTLSADSYFCGTAGHTGEVTSIDIKNVDHSKWDSDPARPLTVLFEVSFKCNTCGVSGSRIANSALNLTFRDANSCHAPFNASVTARNLLSGRDDSITFTLTRDKIGYAEKVEKKDATCTESGISQTCWECQGCKQIFSDENCTNKLANDISGVTIPASGHSLTHYEAQDANCQHDGWVEHWRCEKCNGYFLDAAGLNPTGSSSVMRYDRNKHVGETVYVPYNLEGKRNHKVYPSCHPDIFTTEPHVLGDSSKGEDPDCCALCGQIVAAKVLHSVDPYEKRFFAHDDAIADFNNSETSEEIHFLRSFDRTVSINKAGTVRLAEGKYITYMNVGDYDVTIWNDGEITNLNVYSSTALRGSKTGTYGKITNRTEGGTVGDLLFGYTSNWAYYVTEDSRWISRAAASDSSISDVQVLYSPFTYIEITGTGVKAAPDEADKYKLTALRGETVTLDVATYSIPPTMSIPGSDSSITWDYGGIPEDRVSVVRNVDWKDLRLTISDLPSGTYTLTFTRTAVNKFSVSATLVLTVEETRTAHTVTFDPNGGTLAEADKTRSLTTGDTYGTLPVPNYEGYDFAGWYTEQNGGTKIERDTTVTVFGTQTLYAHWTEHEYTVTVVKIGMPEWGSVTPMSTKAKAGETVTLTATPTTGNQFLEWVFLNKPEGGGWVNPVLTFTMPAEDLTIQAKFTMKNYTISYTLEGVSGGSARYVRWGAKVFDYLPKNPTYQDWVFTGWKCGDVTVTEDMTYGDLAGSDTVSSIHIIAQWHQHEFNTWTNGYPGTLKTPADCTHDAVYYWRCVCGKIEYNDNHLYEEPGTALGHLWSWTSNGNGTHTRTCRRENCNATETDTCSGGTATCTAKAKCSTCNAEYGEKLPHDFTAETAEEQYLKSGSSCTEKAVYYKSCTVCGLSSKGTDGEATFESGSVLGHEWGAWTSNGNATHTRVCSRDASHTETENCSGGTATCTARAVCAVCGGEYGELLAHDFTAEIAEAKYLKSGSTCTEKAVYYKSCAACGLSSAGTASEATFEAENVLGHDWGAWMLDGEGTHKRVCTHDASHVETAGCTYGDWSTNQDSHWKTCTVCGGEAERLNHADPDCNHFCDTCGIKMTEHDFTGEIAITALLYKEANCLSPALYYKSCKICMLSSKGTADEATFAAGETNPDRHAEEPGDWQLDGNSHWRFYTCCHLEVDRGAHQGGTADCLAPALCEVCQHSYGELGPHHFVDQVNEYRLKSAATCTSPAVYYQSCSTCGAQGTETFTNGEPLGHDYGAWTSNGDGTHTRVCAHDAAHTETENCHGGTATCTAKAVCEVCKAEYGEKLPHDFTAETVDAKYLKSAATCTEKAVYYKSCAACGLSSAGTASEATFEAGNVLGHDWGAWTSNGNDTHTRVCSRDASHTETDKCHGGEASCTMKAVCEVCKAEYGEKDPEHHAEGCELEWVVTETEHEQKYSLCGKVTIAKEKHTFGDWTIIKRPTSNRDGEKERICQICQHKEAKTIPATGSNYSYYTIKATAGAGGSISPSGNVSVREGRDQIFTITPDKGYAVSNVKIDGKSIGAVKSYTFENVRRTHTIEVIFMKANGNPQTGVFVDVATGSYYEDAVDWAVENGITTGVSANRFDPNGVCTRAQAVTFLWRAAGSPAPRSRTMPFTDVPVGSYYYDAVLWAVENGITMGTSDTTFSPNMTCSRAQIVAFLWRSEKSPAAGTANPFADVKSTAYYAGAVLWAVKENITKGTTSTTFSPDADCTRAQIVTFLWRCKK